MRSGTGRHRRPRQAPAVVVAAGVTGAGVALPLLGASGAHAVDGTVWDRVAQCESDGVWSANDGTGYYGGFQLTLDTWKRYGGTVHADRPDLASRGQQIAVAEEILAGQGSDAWPTCAVTSGLTAAANGLPESPPAPTAPDAPEEPDGAGPTGGPADGPAGEGAPEAGEPAERARPDATRPGTDPARPEATSPEAGPSAPAEGPDAGAEPTGRPSGAAPDGASARPEPSPGAGAVSPAPSQRAETGEPAGTDRSGGGRHRGEPDPAEGLPSADERSDRSGGRHAAPPETAPPGPVPSAPADDPDLAPAHRVVPGDSLSGIAAEHRVAGGWPALYAVNEEVVGADADLILPGQTLELPTEQP
ncbi:MULTISPECIES: transglycosylase family protein [Streptomyces]|uniref:transglycosylase family protein n=1 Tax=Streptomyces TaxID=1883 RepID=UPI002B0624FD|nr:transglycosylase family protein [Streptomyces sp. JHD 1]